MGSPLGPSYPVTSDSPQWTRSWLQPSRLPSSSQPRFLCSLHGNPTSPPEPRGCQALAVLGGRGQAARVTVTTVLTLGGTVSEEGH